MTNKPLIYFALIKRVGDDWRVSFPDLPDINANGKTFWHAMACAEEILNDFIEAGLQLESSLPASTDFHGRLGYFPIEVRRKIIDAYLRKGGLSESGGGDREV